MPINVHDDFPAKKALDQESIFALSNERAMSQDIRPLKLLIVNLMPKKVETEIQLLRLISKTPLQVDVDFLRMESHTSKNTDISHLHKYYLRFADVKNTKYDALIITGAPVEQYAFQDVDYWDELCEVMEWSKHNVTSTLHICWGAQAGLYYHYGIEKVDYDEKLFGIYKQELVGKHFVVGGFDEIFDCPQSRYTGVNEVQVSNSDALTVLSKMSDVGSNMIMSKDEKNFFILGHLEYDLDTLAKEYIRDANKGLATAKPHNYFVGEDPKRLPYYTWRAHANLLYQNWLNFIYQETPYNVDDIQ
ncbi:MULTISPECIES: homoserine O-succinyltransferase [unclassified Breznakia]|uniref:homoserine O-succinyltransferase n=1 Tax=unclassified Breznakia TaxID=2623764 RepID=UPI002475BF09|nr:MULTISPECIES: homoserine O-succinyltransferase [unclassified Breznakia]MDH6366114.1 homoserine O-succinyltransferase [Breznakia sp. PH1-1]MDH6402954.1 homoserine O-succinyltransferase [Breznakia sp. PF1-11]MDH6410663.1 homoserine O-succinyltransferase [Breznakia sp. PFB1-11]MDH6413280.1 homoserine O-succinyltransferase [Breznakia sp. PFB1-14]MDH6415648.1 homoserine O-succinyltransferase [Breznakia sp. PFB1-4]